MHVIPAIDILDGQAVRLLRGDYEAVTVYHDEPVSLGMAWNDAGIDLLHVVDLDAARGRTPSVVGVIEGLSSKGIRCQVGGGIRTPGNAVEMVAAGADRVVVGSAFVDKDGLGEGIATTIGPDKVVAAIDVRAGRAVGHGWTRGGTPYGDVVKRTLDAGVRTLLVTAIEVDGTMEGPAVNLLESVASIDPSIRLIASGGVGTLDDIRGLASGSCEAIIVGRALYEGRFSIEEAISAATN